MFAIRSVLTMLICASSASAANHYVGGSGTPNYPTIQAAVNAAQPGDVILIASGSYEGFSVTKPLTIAGINGVTVRGAIPLGFGPPISAQLTSRGLLRVVGIQFNGEYQSSQITGGSSTQIEFEDCGFSGFPFTNHPAGFLYVSGFEGFRARACSFNAGLGFQSSSRSPASLTDCLLEGAMGTCFTSMGGTWCSGGTHALSAYSCDVILINCSLRGGNAAPPNCGSLYDPRGNDGGDGVHIGGSGARLWIWGGSFLTAGFPTQGCPGQPAGNPGRALFAQTAEEVFVAADTTLTGAIAVPSGARLNEPPRPRLQIPARPTLGSSPELVLLGTSAGPWEIYASDATAVLYLDGFDSYLGIDPARYFIVATGAPAARTSIRVPIPNDPALHYFSFRLQALEATGSTPVAYLSNVAGIFIR